MFPIPFGYRHFIVKVQPGTLLESSIRPLRVNACLFVSITTRSPILGAQPHLRGIEASLVKLYSTNIKYDLTRG